MKQKKYYDLKSNNVIIKMGDYVTRVNNKKKQRRGSKFESNYKIFFKVISVQRNSAELLVISGKKMKTKVNIKDLKIVKMTKELIKEIKSEVGIEKIHSEFFKSENSCSEEIQINEKLNSENYIKKNLSENLNLKEAPEIENQKSNKKR